MPEVIDSLLRAGGDVNSRTADLGVTPLTLLLQRASSSSKAVRTARDEDDRNSSSSSSRGTTAGLTQLSALTSRPHPHPVECEAESESDDRTAPYANIQTAYLVPKTRGDAPLGSGSRDLGDDSKDPEGSLEWAQTALHLLRSGTVQCCMGWDGTGWNVLFCVVRSVVTLLLSTAQHYYYTAVIVIVNITVAVCHIDTDYCISD